MTIITHTLSGMALGKNFGGVGTMVASGALANLPDLNVFWKKNLYTHHTDFTHHPISILISAGILILLSFMMNIPPILFAMLALWIMHLSMDLFGIRAGLEIFAPINDKQYSFTKLLKQPDASKKEIVIMGLKNGQIVTEIIFALILILYILFS